MRDPSLSLALAGLTCPARDLVGAGRCRDVDIFRRENHGAAHLVLQTVPNDSADQYRLVAGLPEMIENHLDVRMHGNDGSNVNSVHSGHGTADYTGSLTSVATAVSP